MHLYRNTCTLSIVILNRLFISSEASICYTSQSVWGLLLALMHNHIPHISVKVTCLSSRVSFTGQVVCKAVSPGHTNPAREESYPILCSNRTCHCHYPSVQRSPFSALKPGTNEIMSVAISLGSLICDRSLFCSSL